MNQESKKIPKYGSIEWGIYQYEQQKKFMRGHNYRYFNEKWWKKMESKGWKMHQFHSKYDRDATDIESIAKEWVEQYRNDGCNARIICGYHKTRQRTKFYTVIYKSKNKSINN